MSEVDDVVIVAKAIIQEATYDDYMGDYGAYEFITKCHWCNAETPVIPRQEGLVFTHDTGCPVLIAQDLLTRR